MDQKKNKKWGENFIIQNGPGVNASSLYYEILVWLMKFSIFSILISLKKRAIKHLTSVKLHHYFYWNEIIYLIEKITTLINYLEIKLRI